MTQGNNLSNAMRATDAVAPNLAYPPELRLPTIVLKPMARSKRRRRRRGAPSRRRHAHGRGRFPVLLPVRARNRLYWFGPTKHFRVGRDIANRRSINSRSIPKCVYQETRKNCLPVSFEAFPHLPPSLAFRHPPAAATCVVNF